MPVISIENAQIKSASIEIKALTVNGRQLTLSTFRQIPEENLIDCEKMALNGVPWGIINYFWKDNGSEHTHWHIIWQKGKELKRCCIVKDIEQYKIIRELKRLIENQETHREKYICSTDELWPPSDREKWFHWNQVFLNGIISKIKHRIEIRQNTTTKDSHFDYYHIKNFLDEIKLSSELPPENSWMLYTENGYSTRYLLKKDYIYFFERLLAIMDGRLTTSIRSYSVVEKEKLDKLINELNTT